MMRDMDELFDQFWQIYTKNNAHVQKIYDLFLSKEEVVFNDHIALRTFNDPRVNVDQLAKLFVNRGYEAKGEYAFKEKKLRACHYENRDDPNLPKVFISELLLEEFSPALQDTLRACIDQIPQNILHSEMLPLSELTWGPIEHKVYKQLLDESEYAAWVYAFGYQANHFTINVNALKNFSSIEEVNHFLIEHGVVLNDAGGLVKGTPEQGLVQSSTRAGKVEVTFLDGIFEIPSCYYEFAQRFPVDGELYQGFISSSADKIFESTNEVS